MRTDVLLRLSRSHLWLFLCLSSLFLVYPHTEGLGIAKVFLDLMFSASIVFTLLHRFQVHRLVRWLYIVIGLAATISTWVFGPANPTGILQPALYSVFFGFSAGIYFREMAKKTSIDSDMLLGAVCTYLLVGLFFASIYACIFEFDPASFTAIENSEEPMYELIYFSFITLTTVGFGDVVPSGNSTRMLAAYEGVLGQVFVAVVVGVLVGNFVASKQVPPLNTSSPDDR
ncbi:MAG: potassium channel family protein [Planctomycetota bacterium]